MLLLRLENENHGSFKKQCEYSNFPAIHDRALLSKSVWKSDFLRLSRVCLDKNFCPSSWLNVPRKAQCSARRSRWLLLPEPPPLCCPFSAFPLFQSPESAFRTYCHVGWEKSDCNENNYLHTTVMCSTLAQQWVNMCGNVWAVLS